jgi:glycerol-3-phosphate O-acyltransferase
MTVEQIAVRQEIRQLLNEAGINKNTIKDLVREVIDEELSKAVKQVMHEMDIDGKLHKAAKVDIEEKIRTEIKASVDERVRGVFSRMNISIDIKNSNGESIINK